MNTRHLASAPGRTPNCGGPALAAHQLGRVPALSEPAEEPAILVPIADITIVEAWSRRLYWDDIRALADLVDELPPITLTHDLRLVDGRLRLEANVLVQRSRIRAVVLPAGLPETELMARAIQANAHHGRRLTDAERTTMVVHLLAEGWEGTDAELARRCRVSRGKVPELRRQGAALAATRAHAECNRLDSPTPAQSDLQDRLSTRPSRRVGRNGRSYPADNAAQRTRILQLAQEDPGRSKAAIAREVGCSRGTVATVLGGHRARPRRRGSVVAVLLQAARTLLSMLRSSRSLSRRVGGR